MEPHQLNYERPPESKPPVSGLGATALHYSFTALGCLLALAVLPAFVFLRSAPVFLAALVLSWAAGIAVSLSLLAGLLLGICACFIRGQRRRGVIAVVIAVFCAIVPRYLPRVW